MTDPLRDIPAEALDRAAAYLRDADSVLFITGAGLSADSGLPTYRGVGGLYEADDPDEDLPIEVLLSGDMLRRRPDLTWKYLAEIARACRGAGPNRGHEVIAAVERSIDRVWTLTQNVDGLHRAAGARNIIDIHGDLRDLHCTRCDWTTRIDDDTLPEVLPPTCPACAAVVRPDVVLFGEMLPEHKIAQLMDQLDRGFDVVFSVGTSSLFPYIVEPVLRAVQRGGVAIEINPARTDVSDAVTIRLPGPAAATLDAIWSRT